MLVFMLLSLTLPLGANIGFATTSTTTNVSDQYSGQTDQLNGQNIDENSNEQTSQQNKDAEIADNKQVTAYNKNTVNGSNSSTINHAAAGTTTTSTVTTTQTKFTSSQINDAASRVKTFIDNNNRLPSYVTISSVQVSMPQFLQLLTSNLININNGLTTSVTLKSVAYPSNPTENITSGKIYKSGYLSMAKTILSSIDKNGYAPNYMNTSLGKIRYESLIYLYSKILSYQKTNNQLPSYLTVSAWSSGSSEGSGSTVPSSLQKYLVPTTNAPSTSSTIVNLAKSITSGLTSDYSKAAAIFNWVRDHLSYSFYYDSQKGASGALSSRTANCCDTSHLVVALARAAGIPARYQHGTCTFSSGTYGHVWAQLYVNGKWYYADAVSDSNTFGNIKNWNLNTYSLHGTYASLPF
ncbi:MAG: transglutaminase domain-containing protein [Methanobacterium sp.]|nr:transglutaminase domain-containing protein [Methanobacterium sp.]